MKFGVLSWWHMDKQCSVLWQILGLIGKFSLCIGELLSFQSIFFIRFEEHMTKL